MLAQHADRLCKGRARRRGDQRTVHPAKGRCDFGHRIGRGGIDDRIGPKVARKGQLVGGHVDGDDVHAHGLGVLHRHVAQPADPDDGDPLAGAHLRLLEALVHGHTGAKHWRCRPPVHGAGNGPDVIRVGGDVVGIGPVHGIARHLLVVAQRFPSADAMRASPAGRVQPGHADAVPFLQVGDARAQARHFAHTFVPRNEGGAGLHRPVAFGGVKVGVTDARGADPLQDLPRADLRHRHLPDFERLAQVGNDGGFHGLFHRRLLYRGCRLSGQEGAAAR
ncbi:hypothetical protein JDO7802_02385 [Jannaschia donghaensis]|uniref:Uncharacterized protein n=1 Tax=Jannaschia donghaensis TaxID=420998 RepID=A0A0M6YJ20_9RHOB|nr:hypothetical protein JDO7802_02385 [Jannaschia donghaensis]